MPSEPLAFLILLFFFALLLAVLLVWFALNFGARRRPEPDWLEVRLNPEAPLIEPSPVSNDQYRGAKAKPPSRDQRKPRTDAFENFTRNNDDINF